MTRKRLSSTDRVLLRAEDPANPTTITGVMVFGAPVALERLQETIETRLLRFDRFRQRVVPSRLPWGFPRWEDARDFDLDLHLQRVTLSPPADQAALQGFISVLASTPLDAAQPLWQLHLVETYGEGSALVCRLHHSIADGMALVHVLLSMADAGPDDNWPGAQQDNRRGGLPGHGPERPTGRWMRRGLGLLTAPWRIPELSQTGREVAMTLGDLALSPPDPHTLLRGELGVSKRAAWSRPVALQEVKSIGRRMGGTVNDVLLAAMTGALRSYLQQRGMSPDGTNLRAAVPVNMRPPGTEKELGNQVGTVFLPLPVGIADPADRLRELKRRMDHLKGSMEPPVTFSLLKALGLVPSSVQNTLISFLGSKATVLMTNVIGPREKLYLAGAPIEELMFWVPQAGGVGVGVSILSYAGQVRLGVLVDAGVVPDPQVIIDGFHREFEALLALALSAEETPPMAELLAMLDDALRKLDGLLEGEVDARE
jgi:WS/DGAT/MGAT family acyltransferase